MKESSMRVSQNEHLIGDPQNKDCSGLEVL